MTKSDLTRYSDDRTELGYTNGGGRGGEKLAQPGDKNILHVLWRGRWIIFACAVLALGAGFLYLSRQTPVYASESRILVEPEGLPLMDKDGGPTRSGNYLRTQCELLKSSEILGMVAELPELRSMKTFAGVDNPLGLLKRNTDAVAGKNDDLITVSFESPDPAEAANIVNAIVGSYKSYHAKRQLSTAAEVLAILTAEKGKRAKELDEAKKEIESFQKDNPDVLLAAARSGNAVSDRLAKTEDALNTARLAAIDANVALESARNVAQDPARIEKWLKFQQPPATSNLLGHVQALELELIGLSQHVGQENANVKGIELKLAELRARVAQEHEENFNAILADLETRATALAQRVAVLEEEYNEQYARARDVTAENAKYAALQSAAAGFEKEIDLFNSRIKEVQLTEKAGPIIISVLEPGRPDHTPVKPRRGMVLLQALLAGLVLGSGFAIVRDWTDQRLSSVDEIQSLLGLNVLGVLPRMTGREAPAVRGQKVQIDPMSDVAEAYRTIRTAIYFGAPEGKTKRILVTSPAPGDGKTTSASNLAIAMAQAGQRVLLMDCDFRRPMQHRIFGIEDGVGLTSVVAAQIPLREAVKPTGTPGLYLLPSGPIPRNPSEILNSRTFARVLEKLEEKFDHIVIDSPPVMPVTDARILGASCDVTVLVLRAQKSTRRLSLHACESLLSVGSRILGVIVNDVPKRRGGYGYGYGYYQYGYGSGNGNGDGTRNGNGSIPNSALAGRTNGARLPAEVGAGNGSSSH
ncbi:MAG TPA: polysaccharide biosynthesis tyrosine autokinase [Tepidisphaeraceae bacterium]|nr:polysaccharide biosynthesis tyrosine autokinase [Tepidisphaeraceae bacterium]